MNCLRGHKDCAKISQAMNLKIICYPFCQIDRSDLIEMDCDRREKGKGKYFVCDKVIKAIDEKLNRNKQ
jgi:hypothetical protein